MQVKKVFVIGTGTMGSGIAQVCAQTGYEVIIEDINGDVLRRAINNIRWSVGKLIEKGGIKGSAEEILSRIRVTTDIQDAKEADVVIEAVTENLELKGDIFRQLGEICPPHAMLGTNTSSIPITYIAAATKRPDKVVGIHFFNPVPISRLVEVIKGLLTSEETIKDAIDFSHSLGKETIRVNKDVAGFALNRFNAPSTVEAIKLVEQGVASPEDIDRGVRLAYGRPLGPFELADLNGLDVAMTVLENLYQETGDPKFCPPMVLRRKVKAGQLGRKTGVGWYRYDEKNNKIGLAEIV
jgi:3-hydroxybutyryl-CoA dehydrogenase